MVVEGGRLTGKRLKELSGRQRGSLSQLKQGVYAIHISYQKC